MKRTAIYGVLVVPLAVVLLSAPGCRSGSDGGQAPATPAAAAEEEAGRVVAEARVVPARSVALSFSTSGTVAEVLASEGDAVSTGQLLVRLDQRRSQAVVAQAEAGLRGAEARLAGLKAGPRPQEVAAAQAVLAVAEAARRRLQEAPDEGLVAAARAAVANAEAALRQAQAAYDRVSALPGVAARPEALQLEQTTNACGAAQGQLDALLRGPRAGDLAVADAEIARARAQLELIQAGARPEAVAAGEADVAAARAALEQACATLAEGELRAPFAGTVAYLDARAGEPVAAGAVVVRLADLAGLQIESDDVTEMEVAGIREGAPVRITFDALPDLELPGRVTRISPYGASKQGDIIYIVTILPARQDERLRWNMTAWATIDTP